MFGARAFLAATFAFGLAGACSSSQSSSPAAETLPMTSADDAAAAKGTVAVSESSSGDTQIEISVQHLAPPAAVRPDATTYVAWLTPKAAPAQPAHDDSFNLGTLRRGENETASLVTTTHFSGSRSR